MFFCFEQRQQSSENGLGIAHQANVHLMAQANAGRINFDLYAFCLARFGQKFHIGIAGADHDQGVAFFHRVDGGRRAEQAEAARGVRAAIRQHRFAQQRLHHRAANSLCKLGEFFAAAERASAGKDDHLRSRVDDIGRLLNQGLRRLG